MNLSYSIYLIRCLKIYTLIYSLIHIITLAKLLQELRRAFSKVPAKSKKDNRILHMMLYHKDTQKFYEEGIKFGANYLCIKSKLLYLIYGSFKKLTLSHLLFFYHSELLTIKRTATDL